MFARTTWVPCGVLDVEVTEVEVRDPEADLYRGGRPWYLIRTAAELARYTWPPGAVTVVAVEAVRERAGLRPWRRELGPLFWVAGEQVGGVTVDPHLRVIDPSVRFLLRDAAHAYRHRPGTVYR